MSIETETFWIKDPRIGEVVQVSQASYNAFVEAKEGGEEAQKYALTIVEQKNENLQFG